jgi:hypothetical protein
VNVKEEIIQQQKISGQHRTNWSLISIVGFAGSIRRIKRPSKFENADNG